MAARFNSKWPRPLWMATAGVLALGCLVSAVALAQVGDPKTTGESSKQTLSTTGSEAYKTTVERQTDGELTPGDFRQVSTLASQILTHIGAASDNLIDEDWQSAKTELKHVQTLSNVIRDLLPTTTVTTVVQDQAGKEVYRYAERVQNDHIPLYDKMVAVDVLQAVVDKKKEEATLKGIRLADAELIHTSASLDLSYVLNL